MNKKVSADIHNKSFEEAFSELEALIEKLEKGGLPLEEAVATFKRGSLLQEHCLQKLQKAKVQIDEITLPKESPEA